MDVAAISRFPLSCQDPKSIIVLILLIINLLFIQYIIPIIIDANIMTFNDFDVSTDLLFCFLNFLVQHCPVLGLF